MFAPKLAIEGGPPTCPAGPPPWPRRDPAVEAALRAAVADGSWGRYHGPHAPRLAATLAERFGAEHVQLCCSGTFAVQLALRGLGMGEGDEVLLAGYDFPGNFRAIEAVGATPVLVDVAATNWNLDVQRLHEVPSGRIKAVIASHLHGGLVDMAALAQLAGERGWLVVEDACQVPGAIVSGRPAGSWGDAGVLSFGGSKLLTAGRGGAALFQRADAWQRAKIYCEQGNNAFPLSELQALVLAPQLSALPELNEQRRQAAERLLKQLGSVPGLRPLAGLPPDSSAVFYKLGFEFCGEQLSSCSRDEFVRAVQAEGIALDTGFRGFIRRGARRCRRGSSLEVATQAAERALVLHHPVLLEPPELIDAVAAGLAKVCRALANQ